ncbi:MAG TPA: hypothetical protein VFN18_11865 [Solirubrobacterales bacterium]|nr:hypothetical protein [Solirubrobacterales bacterium]
MVNRLRGLLDHPLDPSAARAILAFASAILLGFAVLIALAAGQPDRSASQEAPPAATSPSAPSVPGDVVEIEETGFRPPQPRQDPQDEKGSAAARRAARAISSHRALQHVPYRSGGLKVELVGARGHRAVLRVSADTAQAARAGWREFLRRYRDSGRAYTPIFRGKDGGRNG